MLSLCIYVAAWGQAGYEYHYWFDNDFSTLQTGTATESSWQIEADMSKLTESLHAIHLQVKDSAGIMSSPVTRFFIKMPALDFGELYGRYWFDGDTTDIKRSPQTQGVFDIDVSGLPDGMHTLFYQLCGEKATVSSLASRLFFKASVSSQTKWKCWFDNDIKTLQEGNSIDSTIVLDVTSLDDGYHLLHFLVDGGRDVTSVPIVRPFIKTPQVIGVDSLTCLCIIDDQLYRQEKVSAKGGIVNWNFDVASLPQGFHRMFIQMVTPSGAATGSYQSFFLRSTMQKELEQMKFVYTIDGQEFSQEAAQLSEGTFHFNLDVASLTDGLHQLTYMLADGHGSNTVARTQYFIKTPLGGSGIMKYCYWLNENNSQMKEVTLNERQKSFSLISLLPVESLPLRSSQFDFRIEGSQPVVYAKNDIHIRFYDASGRFTDMSKAYVDESVKENVTDVTLLESGASQTTPKPADNKIKWYNINVNIGDTIAFKSDVATTIQVFSPTGKEVYKASGCNSVAYGGCHTWEKGTYYIALHDVTGHRDNITLDYLHMDKYDIVSQDVTTVGNGGCSTITFKGNGLCNLYAVDLFNESGDTIHHANLNFIDDATMPIAFDFSNKNTGSYGAVFHFTEGKKIIPNLIQVEEAKDIELETEVTYPSSYGHVVTYTCKIHNKGNMTAYAVPIYTWLKSKTLNGITHISYKGLNLPGIFDGVNTDSLSASEISHLRELSESSGEDHHFLKFWVEDEDNPGDSVIVRSNYFFTNIAPNETKILHLTISTTESDVYAYFTIPENWPSYELKQFTSRAKAIFKNANIRENYCCVRDVVECIANLTADAASIANTIFKYSPDITTQTIAAVTDCAAGLASKTISSAGTVFCDNNNVEEDFWDKIHNALDKTSTIGTISSCLSTVLPWKKVKAFFDAIGTAAGNTSMVFGLGVDIADCAIAFSSKKPGCPPTPPGGGGTHGGKSHDPNDIYGYLSKSGSKFVTDSTKVMNYRVEFENDTVFATASAHTVVIKDTLDNNCFDLATYTPMSIKIGDKTEYLDGTPNFVKTIDMRPNIDAIVQVNGFYEKETGIITWTFTSLDPMSMEPTENIMQGFLPVNYNGQGIGEVLFNITQKTKLEEKTTISNRASITFDSNEPILTPTWTNIVDATAPVSKVAMVKTLNDSTIALNIDATDNMSGVWKYDVYIQQNKGASWWKAATDIPADSTVRIRAYSSIENGFCVIATDSAGNVEQKTLSDETVPMQPGDINMDGKVNTTDVLTVYSYILRGISAEEALEADINNDGKINTTDVLAIYRIILGGSASSKPFRLSAKAINSNNKN